MAQFPILTYGKFLLDREEIEDPREPGDTADWAALLVLETDDADELSLAGEYWHFGYHGFLESGEVGRLKPYKGPRVAGTAVETEAGPTKELQKGQTSAYPLVTDPDLIEEFEAGHPGFDPGTLYQA